jgi:hypothetical protein
LRNLAKLKLERDVQGEVTLEDAQKAISWANDAIASDEKIALNCTPSGNKVNLREYVDELGRRSKVKRHGLS